MSIIIDQVQHVDSQLDLIPLLPIHSDEESFAKNLNDAHSLCISQLQKIIRELSTSSSNVILSSPRLLTLFEQANLVDPDENREQDQFNLYENELQWLLLSKAAIHIYGHILEVLFKQIIKLNDNIRYWEKIQASHTLSSLYAVQTSPLRLWSWSREIYHDVNKRVKRMKESSESISSTEIKSDYLVQWKNFYTIISRSIQKRSMRNFQQGILSSITLCQSEVRQNLSRLKKLRNMGASGLGILIVHGLVFNSGSSDRDVARNEENDDNEWKQVLERSVVLMDTVLKNVLSLETNVPEFEDTVFESICDDTEISVTRSDVIQVALTSKISRRLQYILKDLIPSHIFLSKELIHQFGQPSRFIRFWLPAFVFFLSSTTILQLTVNRREMILTYLLNFGTTVRSFCINWVFEPIRNVISTIRHDPDSELALMSKESLTVDRDSLERMVVDFAIDNPRSTGLGPTLTESQIFEIKAKVREGNLTPILRAYEKELKNPLLGTVRGDLIRTLLIQIQKTKVDVEIALNGIDALLKSQELVFGFVGLTPGFVICFAIFRYLFKIFHNKDGAKLDRKEEKSSRILRNIHRILTLATLIEADLLLYKDYGLLLCEIHELREYVHKFFPRDVEREVLQDINDLCDIKKGCKAQLRALKRIRWGYAKWFR